jgi:hypothetical protein
MKILKKIRDFFKLKSPCCKADMEIVDYLEAFGDRPIHKCTKCGRIYTC